MAIALDLRSMAGFGPFHWVDWRMVVERVTSDFAAVALPVVEARDA